MRKSIITLVAILVWGLVAERSVVCGQDWPMWRCDSYRSAASLAALPDGPYELVWRKAGSPRVPAWDDPLNLDLMTYDRIFEPVVLDGRVFIPYSDQDKLEAVDTNTGQTLWTFFADGPVRLPPVAGNGKVYFCSDDGKLYCVNAETGKLEWHFFGGPQSGDFYTRRTIIGNRRLISAWPARGGPVLHDGNLYFAASIWPFMGIFIYAMDAETGRVHWVNDSSGSTYIKQPHSAPSFAGVGPQGPLVATEDQLIVPGGRSVPAVYDRRSGELQYFHLNEGGKGTGGSFVAANAKSFFVHTRLKGVREFDLAQGKKTAFQPNQPVLSKEWKYSAESTVNDAPTLVAYDADNQAQWDLPVDGRGDLVLAGDVLYAAGGGTITAVRLPNEGETVGQVLWQREAPTDIERLLAADKKLFAVTLAGDLLAFGPPALNDQATTPPSPVQPETLPASADIVSVDHEFAERLLAAGPAEGYAVWVGGTSVERLLGVVERIPSEPLQTFSQPGPFDQLAVFEPEQDRVDTLRQQLNAVGKYGRVTVHQSPLTEINLSPYLAHLVVIEESYVEQVLQQPRVLQALYRAVRPFGGTLHLLSESASASSVKERVEAWRDLAELEQAEVAVSELGVSVKRVGALPGSADWTHLHGDIANSRKSDDSRVQLPLGILWFGGSSNMDVLPRHGHGPPQQIVAGRLYIQGINSLSCRDAYTGRVLWKREFDDLGTFDVYYDHTYKDDPLNPAYNQVHIPGANARGTNFVVTSERVYIVADNRCHVLDPASGALLTEFVLPQDDPDIPNEWGFLGVYEDVLLGGVGFAKYRQRLDMSFEEEDGKLRDNAAGFGSKSLDRAGSMALVGMNRFTGEVLWKVDANFSFWHNGIVAGGGLVYCLDKHPKPIEDKLRRRGQELPDSYRILALDAQTGAVRWEHRNAVFGTWLSYSKEHHLLLQAGAAASDRLASEVSRGMAVHQADTGRLQWHQPDLRYSGPCLLHNDLIITNTNAYQQSAGAFDIRTGDPFMLKNPLSGEMQPWKITRAYGCNTILASENLLTFRSGAAGFYDMKHHSGTGNFGGFKSGCTANLIAAGGILNAPDYTRTCSCAYQNQTSLALIHTPELETWTVNLMPQTAELGQRVRQLGVNLNAPGQRRDARGLQWIEFPNLATEKLPVAFDLEGPASMYSRHESANTDVDFPWVFASGIEGAVTLRVGLLLEQPVEKTAATGDQPAAESEGEDKPQYPFHEIAAEPYDLRLFFAAPDLPEQQRRHFQVRVAGQADPVLIELESGENRVVDWPRQSFGRVLEIELIPGQTPPVLSGIEIRKVSSHEQQNE